ncbi:MAG TPA: ankyrin repeat domain-containing protein [Candidatus Solibacter sp.]|nr:ankyrin repeat domain-containing protein [Candidatus Solibacter sp.]
MHRYFALTVLATSAWASDLATAAHRGDWAGVRSMLAKHADVNSAEPDGTTALHWACERNDTAAAKLLLDAHANATATNRYGVTPLSLAARNGNAAIIEMLINSGADPNAPIADGETPLMTASRTGNVEAVSVLLKHGAKTDAKEAKRGQTAIMWAAAEGNVAVMEALIKAGADFRARLDSGFDAFLLAVREGQIPAVRSLLKAGANVNDTIQPNAAAGRKATAFHGAPRTGASALHIAVENAHYEMAAVLLDAGADPNAIGPGYTALHAITNVRKPGLGDNDPAPDGSGNMTSLEMVKKLVEKGADVNARMTKKVNLGLTSLNDIGATAFVMAARTGDAELMRYLAKLGADPDIPTNDGANAVIVAAGLGTRSPGEDAGTPAEVVEALKAALDLGCDVNAVDKNGETAMHGAAYRNHPEAVEFLAAHGAKPEVWNKKNSHGWTPLIIAEGYRFGNYKPSFVTIEAFHKVMKAAGIPIPPPQPIPGETRH